MLSFLLLSLISLSLNAHAIDEKYKCGYGLKAGPNRLEIYLYYPTDSAGKLRPVYSICQHPEVIKDSELSSIQEKYPMVVASHGLGGHPHYHAKYFESLAKRGYIVVAPKHFGSTPDFYVAQEDLKTWNRAKDVKEALKLAHQDNRFKGRVDEDKIYGFGFSKGAYAMLLLACARPENFQVPNADTCKLLEKSLNAKQKDINAIENFEQKMKADYSSKQFAGFFLVAPVLTHQFKEKDSEYSLDKIKRPVYVVLGSADWYIENNTAKAMHNIANCTVKKYFGAQHVSFRCPLRPGVSDIAKVASPRAFDNTHFDIKQLQTQLADDFCKFAQAISFARAGSTL